MHSTSREHLQDARYYSEAATVGKARSLSMHFLIKGSSGLRDRQKLKHTSEVLNVVVKTEQRINTTP